MYMKMHIYNFVHVYEDVQEDAKSFKSDFDVFLKTKKLYFQNSF